MAPVRAATAGEQRGAAPQAPAAKDVAQKFQHRAMYTEFELTLYTRSDSGVVQDLAAIAEEAFAAIDDLESRLSNWIPTSQISYINAHAAQEPIRAAADIIDLIQYSKKTYQETDGAFDVSVGPLIKVYGVYKGKDQVPPQSELAAALALVGMDKVAVSVPEGTVAFAKQGMLLDFGGIGKGLALDEAAEVLKKYGIATALLNGGTSSVMALGAPPDAPGWTVHIRHPYRESDTIDQVVIKNESLSTSGCYGTRPGMDENRLCHIFDPRTGRPIEGMLTAVVLGASGTQADALSTAFMVLGPEKVRAYCKKHPAIRAIIVPVPLAGEPAPEHINFAP